MSRPPVPMKLAELHPIRETVLWGWVTAILGYRLRFQVRGTSMRPLLHHDDEVFVDPRKKTARGDTVVLRHPYRTDVILIKYVASINESGAVYVLGTNLAESTDSRGFGWVSPHLIYGCVRSRFRP